MAILGAITTAFVQPTGVYANLLVASLFLWTAVFANTWSPIPWCVLYRTALLAANKAGLLPLRSRPIRFEKRHSLSDRGPGSVLVWRSDSYPLTFRTQSTPVLVGRSVSSGWHFRSFLVFTSTSSCRSSRGKSNHSHTATAANAGTGGH
jgi:hypothetical protein